MRNQIFVTITVNLLTLIYGISVGWAATNIVLFRSEESPIGQLTTSQISLIASLLCAGGVLGTCFFGWIADIWGRKIVLYLIALPQMLGLLLIAIGSNCYFVYASRVLLGFGGGGVSILIPVFVSEISSEKIRGALGSVMVLMQNVGVLLGYILTSILDYHVMPYTVLLISIAFLILFCRFPDSPEFLQMVCKRDESDAAYKFYGNLSERSSLSIIGKHDVEFVPAKEGVVKKRERITMADFKDPATLRGAFLGITLIIFADLCGSFVIINFLTQIFQVAHIELDIYLSTIIVGIIQIIGSSIATGLVDRCGRRMLIMWSALGAGLCLTSLAIYFHLLDHPDYHLLIHQLSWLPIVALAGTILISTLGVTTLPFFVITELLPVKLRSLVSTVCLGLSWALVFVMLQFYQDLNVVLGIDGTMALFAVCCFLDIVFVYVSLPETKNLTFDEIRVKLSTSRGKTSNSNNSQSISSRSGPHI